MDGNSIVTILVAVFASTGFWQLVNAFYEKRSKKKDAKTEMLLGLAHDRIYDLCSTYLRRGYVTHFEYDNLMYLYRPYQKMGGNGTGAKLMEEVDKLPVRMEEEE